MTNIIPLNTGTGRNIVAVKLPEDKHLQVWINDNVLYWQTPSDLNNDGIKLPSEATLLFTTSIATEEDAMGVVDTTCEYCGGDGIETCNNPDHGFINAVGGELQRLGCPVCGHDENHKVRYWKDGKYEYGKCDYCFGTGHVDSLESLTSLLKSHGLEGNWAIIEVK